MGVRIDNCAKLLPAHPCQAQIRLVFQPGGGDQGFHLIFNIDNATAIGMYQDFYDLKKSALPETTGGNLDLHPILAKESMKGSFSERFKKLLVKYALPSRYDRIAVMGSGGDGATWEFAASQPIKNGIVKRTPIPCLKADQPTNILNPGLLSGLRQDPAMTGCDAFNIEDVTYAQEKFGHKSGTFGNNPASIAAVKTVNPEQTFFGSTTCANCHEALREVQSNWEPLKEAEATFAKDVAYKYPTDVTQGEPISKGGQPGFTDYPTRAFGYGERGELTTTRFTVNDTMRVAHELNDLIRAGKIK